MLTAVLAATLLIPLTPAYPDPTPAEPGYGTFSLLPNYVVNGDGTRMQCTPNSSYCWRDNTGLPSYLIPS